MFQFIERSFDLFWTNQQKNNCNFSSQNFCWYDFIFVEKSVFDISSKIKNFNVIIYRVFYLSAQRRQQPSDNDNCVSLSSPCYQTEDKNINE